MYYRYKSKKKDRKLLKLLLITIIVISAVYTGYSHRYSIMFWRISHNKIMDQIVAVSAISDMNERMNSLKKLSTDIEVYKKENPSDPESYIYSARIYFYLGMVIGGKNFTELYLDDLLNNISPEQRKYYIQAIKDSNKAMALLDGKDIDPQDLFILGKAYFITGYKNSKSVYTLLKNAAEGCENLSAEDARFFSLLCLASGSIEEGLAFLDRKTGVEDTIQGKLFKAKALKDAMKFTDAIIAFQKILKSSEDPYVLKLSYMNLGKIYFSQNLFKESLDQFNAALSTGDDLNCKIWIGKNYSAMGMTDKAKSIWNEVLTANGENEEVKKLLGLL